MVDASVGFLLNNLKELVDHHSHLIKDTRGHIESLQRDLQVFNAFLKDSVEKRRDDIDHRTKVMIQEIREVVYKMEDIIDTSHVNTSRSSLISKFWKNPFDFLAIGQRVKEVRERAEQARADIGIVTLKDEHKPQQSQDRPPRKKDVVGFEDEAEDLINRLTRDSDYFEVISLIGMLGLGKTTLAWKVFTDKRITHKFPTRIWISISQDFSDRGIFLSILKELTTVTEEIKSKNDDEIANLVIANLAIDRGSFLIVMDDVWETAHWRRLNVALPNNIKGKVLITSRNEHVGNVASRQDSIKKLRCFNDDESWKLLRLEALNTFDCPSDLENVGRIIAKNCGGLPLAVVIIGGILAAKSKDPNTSSVMEEEWGKVSKGVSAIIHEKDPEERMRKLISLSYDRLPYHLRSCFLYFGMFPEDYEISASKLIRMWIGEGFIQQSESCSLEETAKEYLEELINRNLVKGEKLKHDGKVKACRIHDTLRNFCRTEAAYENLVKEIKYVNNILTPPISDIDKYRRLSIHSNCLEFISSKPLCPHARSFVCFSKDKFVVDDQNSTKIFAAFKLLKVLDIEPFKFEKIDTNIFQLVCMRYLVLSCDQLSILAPKYSELSNIQTLVVNTTKRILEVKADIWEMKKLRYFKTNASAKLPKPTESSKGGKELQTLSTISVESCTPELFNLASNLKKLGIRGNLHLLSDESFNSLGNMVHIENLKLIHDVYPLPCSERPFKRFRGPHRFPPHQFPSGLMRLTLRATFLSWDAMSTLGLLKKLKVLKLKENAFMGSTWEAMDGGFECLQLLHIEDTDLMIWNASSHHYPKLKSLVVRNCENLLAIPIGMARIKDLQSLELYICKYAAASARAIKEEKINTHPAFMLSIYP